MERLSGHTARRIALAAQGFADAPVSDASRPSALARVLSRTALFQMDSVSVIARAHHLPAFSRLGPYPVARLHEAAWGKRNTRTLFEYWAHEASLLPMALQPLLRWRMARAEAGGGTYGALKGYAGEKRPVALAILERIRAEGPLAASDLEGMKGSGGWWGWSEGKGALEWLFWAGLVTTATRRPSFERVYDLPRARAARERARPAHPA